jgi:hypothetical protein
MINPMSDPNEKERSVHILFADKNEPLSTVKSRRQMDEVSQAVHKYVRSEVQKHTARIVELFEKEVSDTAAREVLRRLTQTLEVPSPVSHRNDAPSPSQESSSPEEKHFDLKPGEVTCAAVIKTGARKGQLCRGKVFANSLCKRHCPRETSQETCPALMKSGARKGQPCGGSIAVGDTLCSKHKITKCVFKPAGARKCCGKSISKYSPSETHCRLHLIDEMHLDTDKFILYKNKFGNSEHRYSELVFENKKVVGVQNPSGHIDNYLNEEDLECVVAYRLPVCEELKPRLTAYLNEGGEEQQ